MTSVSTLSPLGDPKNGGAFFILPRQVRDEIYRLLVVRRYTVFDPSERVSGVGYTGKSATVDRFNSALLQLSHAIGHEVREVLYSESIFRYSINFSTVEPRKPPTALVNRMKKVKMLIWGLASKGDEPVFQNTHPLTYKDRIAAICEATIDDFTGTQILRDVCHIQLPDCHSDMIELLERYILPKLAALNGFRTLLVQIFTGMEQDATTRFERVMKDAMEPTLGPATTSYGRYIIALEFHPRDHVPSLFERQSQISSLDANGCSTAVS